MTLEEEIAPALKAARESKADILHLEPEEQERDEVMKYEDEEDDK